jgi:hypothetical protein
MEPLPLCSVCQERAYAWMETAWLVPPIHVCYLCIMRAVGVRECDWNPEMLTAYEAAARRAREPGGFRTWWRRLRMT